MLKYDNSQKILLVDQHLAFVEAFAQQLQSHLICDLEVVASMEALRQQIATKAYDVVLCSLNLSDADQQTTLDYLSSIEPSVLVLSETYSEEIEERIRHGVFAGYLIQDSAAAVEHAVDVAVRLLNNAKTPIWLLSIHHENEIKLQSLLQTQRFPLQVFNDYAHLDESLGLTDSLDGLLEPVLPKLLLITGATLHNCNELIHWLDHLRSYYDSAFLPVMLCGRPEDLRVTHKLLKYGVNDFYNLHFTPEEFYIRIEQNLSKT